MVNQENKTPDDEMAKLREELKKELKQKRKELSGKSLDDLFAEVSSKSFDELVVKIKEEAAKIIRLVVGDNDWQEVQPKIAEKAIYLRQLQEELVSRPKKLGGYKKWAEAVTIERRAFSLVEKRDIEENRELFTERLKDLNAVLESNKWSAGEILQISILTKLEKMIFDNSKSSAEGRLRSIENSISDIQFQAEVAETMLEVRERLESSEQVHRDTANILEKVEERLESSENILRGVKENTNPAQQFILVVLASAVVAIFVGFVVDVILLRWREQIENHALEIVFSAIGLLFIAIGVFAALKIKKRVKKN